MRKRTSKIDLGVQICLLPLLRELRESFMLALGLLLWVQLLPFDAVPYGCTCIRATAAATAIRSNALTIECRHSFAARKSDPVARHQQHAQFWSRNKCKVVTRPSSAPTKQVSDEVRQRHHKIIPTYVIPSAKRRDNLRLEVRNRMLATEREPLKKTLPTPNTYIVPTDRRRDSLRWQVRLQMNE